MKREIGKENVEKERERDQARDGEGKGKKYVEKQKTGDKKVEVGSVRLQEERFGLVLECVREREEEKMVCKRGYRVDKRHKREKDI